MHYSNAMKTESLTEWAECAARKISEDEDIKEYTPVLAYRGMSGIASATALSIALHGIGIEFEMFYVRKEGEKSHGESYEMSFFPSANQRFLIIFVDDFIVTGDTYHGVIDKVNRALAYFERIYACAMSGRVGERIGDSERMGYFNRKNVGIFSEFLS